MCFLAVLNRFSHVQLSVTLRTITFQVPLSMGFSRQEDCSELPVLSPGVLPHPGIEPASLTSLVLAGGRGWGFFTTSATWEALIPSVQFSSVTQSCPTLCNPMNRSTPGLPVHHQLLEFTQTHVHRVSDAIQPSHPLSSPSPPAPSLSQHQSFPMSQFFAAGGQSIGGSASASVLSMNIQN